VAWPQHFGRTRLSLCDHVFSSVIQIGSSKAFSLAKASSTTL
jgi:hypothetical protein